MYIDDNKEIDTANVPTCTCERGQFRCHHTAVAMLRAYKSVSSTDQTCIWSRPKSTTAVTLRTVSDMYPDVNPAATLDRPVCDDDRGDFLQSLLQENRQSAMTWFLLAEPTETTTAVPFVYEIVCNLFPAQQSHTSCHSTNISFLLASTTRLAPRR